MGDRYKLAAGLAFAAALGGAGAVGVTVASDQGTFRLRYRPAVGAVLPRVTETITHLVFVNLPSLPDSTPVEVSTRTMVTHRVRDSGTGPTSVDVSYDSAQTRVRVAGGAPDNVPLAGVQRRSVQFRLDERMQVSTMALDDGSTVDSSFAWALLGYDGGIHIVLPEEPVAPGATWSSPTRFAIGPALGASVGFTAVELLTGTRTLLLDSLVARGADTLAYLTTEGTIGPDAVGVRDDRDFGTASFRGRLAGRLVWSTSWHGFVSGVLSGSMRGTLTVPRLDNPIDATLVVRVSAWHQVRP